MLASIKDKALRELASDAFARARVKNGLVTPSGRLSKYDGEDDHLNIKGAARRLGLTPHTMRVLLRKLAIVPKHRKNLRGLRLNEGQLASVQKYIQSAYDSEEAAKRLGCTSEDIESLAARKLLLPAFRMVGRNRYTNMELDAFVNSITSPSLSDTSLDGKYIAHFAEQVGISLAEASSRILRDKSLVVVDHSSGPDLFKGLKVADAPKKHLHARLRPKAQVRDAITYAEAAARLGTKHEGIKSLIKASLIKTIKDPRHKERVCPASLELFESRYVKAAAYSPALGCHPTSALKILRTMGVLPINDWKSAGTRFVDRDEVMRITGLPSPETAVSAEWFTIKDELEEHLAARDIPATTRITSEPAIEVKATTGRWSFIVRSDQDRKLFSLTSSFTSKLQPARLRKVEKASIEPGKIWPGASVNSADGRGFLLVDEALGSETDGATEFNLVDHVITRACQLHRFL
ncbi:hypothetical protein [Erythrobacter crassostreae]|nr:hypothetical protein [Erythrobacter crassostrea]